MANETEKDRIHRASEYYKALKRDGRCITCGAHFKHKKYTAVSWICPDCMDQIKHSQIPTIDEPDLLDEDGYRTGMMTACIRIRAGVMQFVSCPLCYDLPHRRGPVGGVCRCCKRPAEKLPSVRSNNILKGISVL